MILLPMAGFALLLLGACAAPPQTPPAPSASLHLLIDDTLTAPSSAATERLLADLGVPLRSERHPVAELHDPSGSDRVRILIYRGVRAVVLEAEDLGRDFLIELEVTSGAHTTPEGIGIGSSRSEVVAAFGERLALRGDGLELILTLAGDTLSFEFADERVVRMVWRFYTG